jgi:hypothetical protein
VHLDQAGAFNLNPENAPVRENVSNCGRAREKGKKPPVFEEFKSRGEYGALSVLCRLSEALDRGLSAPLLLSCSSIHVAGSLLFAQTGDQSDSSAVCVTRKVATIPGTLVPSGRGGLSPHHQFGRRGASTFHETENSWQRLRGLTFLGLHSRCIVLASVGSERYP